MSPIITVALPVFAVIAAGFAAGRSGLAPAVDVAALNRFVFRFAMPAGLFGLTAGAEPPGRGAALLAGVYGIAAMTVVLSAYAIGRNILRLKPQEAGAHAFASTLGNAVFLGLPIALAVPGWAENFVVLMLVEGLVVIAIGAGLIAPRGSANPLTILTGPFRNPLVAAMLAGLALAIVSHATGFETPAPLRTFIDILGRAAGPTALFSMGLFLATNPPPQLAETRAPLAAIICLKMIALPAMMFAGLKLAALTSPSVVGPAMLFAVVPTGVGAFVIASNYGIYERETAAAVAVTTTISVLTVSAVLAVYA